MPNPFEYQRPTADQVRQIEAVRLACGELHALLLILPAGRERSLAVTKLEEVSMWANKGIVFADPGLSLGWVNPFAPLPAPPSLGVFSVDIAPLGE